MAPHWTLVRIVACVCMLSCCVFAQAPIESLRDGFKRWEAGRLTLVTDLPIDDEFRAWPEILDQAVATWTEQWRLDPVQSQSWRMTAYVIGDRQRFVASGLVPQVPAFEDGYQAQDTVFLIEQPSIYYRRHLFLHEATHWAMYRAFGGAGSPFYMEGMADLYGTHRWSDRKLVLGIIPAAAAEVPQWGRFKRIQEMLARGDVPNLRQILFYTNDTNRRMDRYVWSWAACYFFAHHPRYREAFIAAGQPPLDYSTRVSQQLLASLESRWPWVVADWNGFLSDFDFGYDPARSIPDLSAASWENLGIQQPVALEVDAARGWQATGIRVRRGETLQVAAKGSYQVGVGADGKPWMSEPQGVTVRYVGHQPLGRLMATIVPIPGQESTGLWKPLAVGRGAAIPCEMDGLLLLKINDASGGLGDNQGRITATLQAVQP